MALNWLVVHPIENGCKLSSIVANVQIVEVGAVHRSHLNYLYL
jgi:hypothetical protein